ncbi:MAG: segregation and condensation protein A [Planctomycetota bacterium JB042]
MTYSVALDNFSGPMDLLLHLVKQEEVEINEIPIAKICDRYLSFIKEMQELDVDVAGEFLVMASTLMLIKSRTLLPIEEEVDLEEELNPEDELIQQLLEYKRFKMASRDLKDLAQERALIYPYRPPKVVGEEKEIELEEIDLMDLVKAFAVILKETGFTRMPRLLKTEKPLREYIDEVFAILRERKAVRFTGLFEGSKDRESVIGRFLALLELARRGRVRAAQVGSFDEIEISLKDESDFTLEEFQEIEVEMGEGPTDEERELLGSAADSADGAPAETSGSEPASESPAAPPERTDEIEREMEAERWPET